MRPDARRQAAAVILCGVASALHIGKLPASIPVLRAELGISLVQAGLLLSLVQFAGMSLGLVVGMAADRFGPRRVMQIGLAILALASCAGATAHDVHGLLLARVAEGMGFLLAVLPAPALIRRVVKEAAPLSRALGWWGAYMPLGTSLALLLVPLALTVTGWPTIWVTLGIASLACLALLSREVPAAVDGAQAVSALGMLPRLRETLGSPGPWVVAAAFGMYSAQWLSVIGFLPTIYAQAGLTGAAVGGLTALASAVNMGGNIAAGRLLGIGINPVRILVAGFCAMGLGAWVAFGSEAPPVGRYLAVLVFSGVGGIIPGTLFSMAVRLAPGPATVSATVGWVQQWSALGQVLGPPAVAWLATQVGHWQWTWVVTGSCCLAGLALSLGIGRLLALRAS